MIRTALKRKRRPGLAPTMGAISYSKNLFHLVQAYELAEQALGGKRNADTVVLAMYFVPQPVNRKTAFTAQ